MTTQRWQQIHALFERALQQDPALRPAFLARQCGIDAALYANVLDLLDGDERARQESFLARDRFHPPARYVTAEHVEEPEVSAPPSGLPDGRRFGPYQLQECLGSGGMGSVYRAIRTSDYRQVVAVKLIKTGMESAESRQRFCQERQVLASLNHPHIARLLDGGVTDNGLPYLVMEYIDGQPINRYCNSCHQTTAQRLQLFQAACLAMHYAHERAVIHRDLKPDNILVTADGCPKITDFGLAKSMQGREYFRETPEHASTLTQTGAILGSPSFMAPEQASGNAKEVGAAADIYALGAILYELLTGRPPFRAETPLQTVLQVLHDEPLSPGHLHANLPRDLETICMKCLEKEPAKRYVSAADLAADVARFLAGEPIRARPVKCAERLWRWCRRKPLVAGLLATLVLIVCGSIAGLASLWRLAETHGTQAIQEKDKTAKQRDHARRAYDDTIRIAERWLAAEPGAQRLQREFLEQALKYYEELVADPQAEPEVRHTTAQICVFLGRLHPRLGEPERGLAAYRRALDLWAPLARDFPENPLYSAELCGVHKVLAEWAGVSAQEKDYHWQQALSRLQKLVEDAPGNSTYGDWLANVHYSLGRLELRKPGFGKAESYFLQGRTLAEKLAQEHGSSFFKLNVVRNLRGLGYLQHLRGEWDKAATTFQDSLREQVVIASKPIEKLSKYDNEIGVRVDLGDVHSQLAETFYELEKWPDAVQHVEESLKIIAEVAKVQPMNYGFQQRHALVLAQVGLIAHAAGRTARAEKAYQQSWEILRRTANDFPALRLQSQAPLAWWLVFCPVEHLRDSEQALLLAREGVQTEPDEWRLILGVAAFQTNDLEESVATLQQAVAQPEPNASKIHAGLYLAMAHKKNGADQQARQCFEQAVRDLGKQPNRELRDLCESARIALDRNNSKAK